MCGKTTAKRVNEIRQQATEAGIKLSYARRSVALVL